MGKIAIFLALALSGCATASGGQFCQISKPIRPEATDVALMSDSLAAQILAYNEKQAKLCGAKP